MSDENPSYMQATVLVVHERKNMLKSSFKKIATIGIAGALACGTLGMVGCSGSSNSSSASSSASSAASSSAQTSANLEKAADPIGTHHAIIEIEGYGPISVELDGDSAPVTVQNFIDLAESGFYDGLTFHRIIEGFMMQGGDPLGNGTGGSDETIVGEFTDNGYDNELENVRGAIAMARSSMPDSASSQFYIVQEDSPFLDGQYAVFGNVTDGMDIVDAICSSAKPTDSNGTISADQQPKITKITIVD